MIPIWLGFCIGFGCALFGFFACAILTAGKVAEARDDPELWDELCATDAAHKRVTDALAAKNARIQTLTDIARSQQSIKSGRILDVLEG